LKNLLLLLWLGVLFGAISAIFWYNDYIFKLPTPVPQGYQHVQSGAVISLPAELAFNNKKPVFIHFFNPDCPCSRFNIAHFRTLVKEYGDDVNFSVAVMNTDKYNIQEIKAKIGFDLPVTYDTTLATTCGVYSTPQAVLLNTDGRLFYRGNYNKSRYCSDKKTNYAQIALNEMVNGDRNINFDRYALTAYGCQLPKCTK
jgi:hypothetical protein